MCISIHIYMHINTFTCTFQTACRAFAFLFHYAKLRQVFPPPPPSPLCPLTSHIQGTPSLFCALLYSLGCVSSAAKCSIPLPPQNSCSALPQTGSPLPVVCALILCFVECVSFFFLVGTVALYRVCLTGLRQNGFEVDLGFPRLVLFIDWLVYSLSCALLCCALLSV